MSYIEQLFRGLTNNTERKVFVTGLEPLDDIDMSCIWPRLILYPSRGRNKTPSVLRYLENIQYIKDHYETMDKIIIDSYFQPNKNGRLYNVDEHLASMFTKKCIYLKIKKELDYDNTRPFTRYREVSFRRPGKISVQWDSSSQGNGNYIQHDSRGLYSQMVESNRHEASKIRNSSRGSSRQRNLRTRCD